MSAAVVTLQHTVPLRESASVGSLAVASEKDGLAPTAEASAQVLDWLGPRGSTAGHCSFGW